MACTVLGTDTSSRDDHSSTCVVTAYPGFSDRCKSGNLDSPCCWNQQACAANSKATAQCQTTWRLDIFSLPKQSQTTHSVGWDGIRKTKRTDTALVRQSSQSIGLELGLTLRSFCHNVAEEKTLNHDAGEKTQFFPTTLKIWHNATQKQNGFFQSKGPQF